MNTLSRIIIGIATGAVATLNCLGQAISHAYAPDKPMSASDQQAASSDLTGKRGHHQVDAFTGKFGYSIPIVGAPARNGSQPALSLAYSSGGESSWCGVGWRLDIGYIERNTKDGFPIKFTTATPPAPDTKYDDTKGFILNLFGKEYKLIKTATIGTTDEYRPEVDTDFIRCLLDTSANTWSVTDKGGNVYYFAKNAATSNARVSNPKTGWTGWSGTFHWALDEINTVTGDQTLINYETFNDPEGLPERTIYPKDITYNGHVNLNGNSAVFAGQHKIIIEKELRPDRRFSYRWGFRTEQNRRLLRITTQVGPVGSVQYVSKYDFGYQIGAGPAVSTATHRSLLRTVTVSGYDTTTSTWTALPVQTFTYQQNSTPLSFGSQIQWKNLNLSSPFGTGINDYEIAYAYGNPGVITEWDLFDIDGDGLPDRVMYDDTTTSPKYYRVQRNIGLQADGNGSFGVRNSGGGTTANNTRFLWGPTSSGGGVNTPPSDSNLIPDWYDWASLNNQHARLRDIDGDGLPDKICDYWKPFYNGNDVVNTPYDKFEIMLNTGSGFSTVSPWSVDRGPYTAPNIANNNGVNDLYLYSCIESGGVNTGFFDINGDGLPDRVMSMYPTEGAMIYFRVQFNTGAGFTPVKQFGPYKSQNYNTGPASYSGIGHYPAYYWAGIETPEAHMIDINGDGLLDRVMYPIDTTTGSYEKAPPTPGATSYYMVEYNNGYGFEAVDTGVGIPGSADQWTGVTTQGSLSGTRYDAIMNFPYVGLIDVNGDGLPDRVAQDESSAGLGLTKRWLVYLNNGRSFDTTPITVTGIYDPSNSTTDHTWWGVRGTTSASQTVSSLIDMNGDGLLDRVVTAYDGGSNPASTYFWVQLNNGPYPDLLTGIDNGIGGVVTIAYKSSTAYDNRKTPSNVDSGSLLPFPVQVASTITENDGINGNRTTTYNYEGGFYNGTRREFSGFAKVTITEPLPLGQTSSRKKVYFFHQGGGQDHTADGEFSDTVAGGFAKRGIAYRIETWGNDTPTPLLYSVILNQVDLFDLANGRYFPYVKQTFAKDFPGGGTEKTTGTTFTFDSTTGNLTKKVVHGSVNLTLPGYTLSDNDGAHVQYHTIHYAALSNTTIVDHPDIVSMASEDPPVTVLQETKYTYDQSSGALFTEQHRICPGQYAVTTHSSYDTYGLATIVSDPVGIETKIDSFDTANHIFPTSTRMRVTAGVDSSNDHITASTFDARSGLVLTAQDVMGINVQNDYDQYFRLTKVTKSTAPNTSPTLVVKQLSYGLGIISSGAAASFVHVKVQDGTTDTANGTGSQAYTESRTYFDGFARPVQTRTEAEAAHTVRVVSTAYDERGEAYLTTWPSPSSAVDLPTAMAFSKPSGTLAASYTQYDAAGRVYRTYRRKEATFTSTGAVQSVADPTNDAGSPLAPKQWTYVKTGTTDPWWIECTDEDGKIRRYGLDGFGRTNVIEEVDGASTYTSTLTYDRIGNLTDLKDSLSASATIHYCYDDVGRTVGMADPHLGQWTYKRDNLGRIREQVDGNGQKVELIYGATLKRLSQKNVYNSLGQQTSTATYSYDVGDGSHTVYKGLLFQVIDSEGWEKNSYDTRGRLQSSTRHLNVNNVDYTTTYGYNDADKVSSIVYPNSGPTINYTYYAGGGISQVSRGAYNYYSVNASDIDEFGHVLQFTYGNGVVNNRTYYPKSKRLSTLTAGTGGSILNKSYQYSAGDDVLNISGKTFTYDDLHRLKTHSDLTSGNFTYDQVGNILHNREPDTGYASGSDYTYALTRTEAVRTAYGRTYLYDKCGNMVVRHGDSSGSQKLDYDGENRLVRFWQSGTIVAEFGYAEDGDRLWKRKNQDPNTLQVWIGNIYEEKLASDGVTRKTLFHVFAGAQRICTFEPSSTLNGGANNSTVAVGYYYHQDHLNSSSALSGDTGTQLEVNLWYPFGRVQTATPQASLLKVSNQFTGHVKDEETGLYYYGARYFDPELGRFIQADTIIPDLWNPQSYNRYSYGLNNPFRYVDPTGHNVFDAVLNFGGGVVIGVGQVINPIPAQIYVPIPGPSSTAEANGRTFGRSGAVMFSTAETLLGVVLLGGGTGGEVITLGGATPIAVPAMAAGAVMTGHGAIGINNYIYHSTREGNSIDVTRKIPREDLKYQPSERGNAPTGSDDKPVELHHTDQTKGNASPRAEMTRTEHRGEGNFSKNHPNTGQKPSTVDRTESSQQHRDYWKKEWDSGAFKNLPKNPDK